MELEILKTKKQTTKPFNVKSSSSTTCKKEEKLIALRKRKLALKSGVIGTPGTKAILDQIIQQSSIVFDARRIVNTLDSSVNVCEARIRNCIIRNLNLMLSRLSKGSISRSRQSLQASIAIESDSLWNAVRKTEEAKPEPSSELLRSWFAEYKAAFESQVNLKYIEQTLEQEPGLSVRKLAQMYNESNPQFPKLTKDSILTIVKEKLGFKFGKIHARNRFLTTETFKKALCIYLAKFTDLCNKGVRPIFIDECYFRRISNRKKGWFSASSYSNQKSFGSTFRDTCTLTVACSETRIIHFAINRKNNTSLDFVEFARRMIEKVKSEHSDSRFFLALDNATIHKTKKVKELFEASGVPVLFLVPYFCEINLAEYVFSNLKMTAYRSWHDSRFLYK